MTKLTDEGELEIVKRVHGFEGVVPRPKADAVERAEIRNKKQTNQAR